MTACHRSFTSGAIGALVHFPLPRPPGADRLDALAHDRAFMAFMRDVHTDLRSYLETPRWFQGRTSGPLQSVAYLSPEFGIAEALPQYSGGLGVLAGDHLKAASDLGVP